MTDDVTGSDLRVISGLDPVEVPGAPDESVSSTAFELDQRTYARSLDCVHCGLCLPACPTYTQNGLEADSPRGRIVLMKGLADRKIAPTDSVLKHLDLCLDCRACETACPSGVVYHELIEQTRSRLAQTRRFDLTERLMRAMFFKIMTKPTRLKVAMLPVRVLQKLGLWNLLLNSGLLKLLPASIQKMQQMVPTRGRFWEPRLDEHYPATSQSCPGGERQTTVMLLSGCVGGVLFQDVNRQTIRLLQHAGCDVIVPRSQTCCGAIHHHGGDVEGSRRFARANIDVALPRDRAGVEVDHIVTNISGCGAALKEYGHLLCDDSGYAERAKTFGSKVRDISELLVELDLPRPTHRVDRKVTFHHACHLIHAQKVSEQPLQMLSWIDGLTVVPLAEADMCCGAAGTYNLSQPEMAGELAQRKIRHIQETGANIAVMGNVGCAMQIQSEAERLGVELQTAHPVSLLYEACFGNDG